LGNDGIGEMFFGEKLMMRRWSECIAFAKFEKRVLIDI
jgi:hypothetical protein